MQGHELNLSGGFSYGKRLVQAKDCNTTELEKLQTDH